MPFLILDNETLPYISVNMSGRHDDQELIPYQDAIYSSPGFCTKDQLIDYTEVTDYAVTSGGLDHYTKRALKRLELLNARKDRKIALVPHSNHQFGMSRVFVAFTENMPANYQVFRTRAEAIAWFDSDLEQ